MAIDCSNSNFTNRPPEIRTREFAGCLQSAPPSIFESMGKHGCRSDHFIKKAGNSGWRSGLFAWLLLVPTLGAQEATDDPPPPDELPAEAVLPDPQSPAKTGSEEEAIKEKPAPAESTLIWWNRPIVVFRSPSAPQVPEARRAEALKRVESASEHLFQSEVTTEFVQVEEDYGYRFLVEEEFLFTILKSDLDQLKGEDLETARKQIVANLNGIRAARIEQSSAEGIARAVTSVLIATAILIGALFVLRLVVRFFAARLKRIIANWKRLKLARADLRPHIATLAEQFAKAAGVIVGLYLCSYWIAFCFSQFPLTEPLGTIFTSRLKDLATGLLGTALHAIPGVFTAIVILLLTRWLARMVDRVIRSMGRSDDSGVLAEDTAKATRRIAMVVIWLFGLVLAYPYLPGSGSDAFKGMSLLIGLMVSLGSSGMINQIMSGFVLLYSGSVRTGEYVKIGQIEGTVTEMGILAIKILTPQKEYLTIPNAVVVSNPSTNYTRLSEDTGVPISVTITIGYDAPWRQVHQLLMEAAAATEGILPQPEPRVLQKALCDWYAEYVLTAYTGQAEGRAKVLSELNGQIQDAFNECGIQIMSPHYHDDKTEPLVIPRTQWYPEIPPQNPPPPKP